MTSPDNPKFAPRETFLEIQKWMPIPTFDLILEYRGGIILAKRTIEPYKDVWALPGLRKYKGESIDYTLKRIAESELGLIIEPKQRIFVSQFVGQFQEENRREDISTCYLLTVSPDQELKPNRQHFADTMILTPEQPIPQPTGEMYKFYLEQYRGRLIN